jgi:hypothetical protein
MSDRMPKYRDLLTMAFDHITLAGRLSVRENVSGHELDQAHIHAVISQALTALAGELVQADIWGATDGE